MLRRIEDSLIITPESRFNHVIDLFDRVAFNLNAPALEELSDIALSGNREAQQLIKVVDDLKIGKSLKVTDSFIDYMAEEKGLVDRLDPKMLSGRWREYHLKVFQKLIDMGYIPSRVNTMSSWEWMEKWNPEISFGHCINGCGFAWQYRTLPEFNEEVIFECDKCYTEWEIAKPKNLKKLERRGYSWNGLHFSREFSEKERTLAEERIESWLTTRGG